MNLICFISVTFIKLIPNDVESNIYQSMNQGDQFEIWNARLGWKDYQWSHLCPPKTPIIKVNTTWYNILKLILNDTEILFYY